MKVQLRQSKVRASLALVLGERTCGRVKTEVEEHSSFRRIHSWKKLSKVSTLTI